MMMKKIAFYIASLAVFMTPLVYAQEKNTYAERLVDNIIKNIINPIILVLMGLALAVFIWGVIEFIAKSGEDTDAVVTGKRHMIYGIIGLAIMVSVFGIMNLICNFIGAC